MFPDDVEVLTTRGFVAFPELDDKDGLIIYDVENEELRIQLGSSVMEDKYVGDLIRFSISNGVRSYRTIVTQGHNILYFDKFDNPHTCSAVEAVEYIKKGDTSFYSLPVINERNLEEQDDDTLKSRIDISLLADFISRISGPGNIMDYSDIIVIGTDDMTRSKRLLEVIKDEFPSKREELKSISFIDNKYFGNLFIEGRKRNNDVGIRSKVILSEYQHFSLYLLTHLLDELIYNKVVNINGRLEIFGVTRTVTYSGRVSKDVMDFIQELYSLIGFSSTLERKKSYIPFIKDKYILTTMDVSKEYYQDI